MSILLSKVQKINKYLKNLNRTTFIIIITFILFFVVFCFNYTFGFVKQYDVIFFNFQNDEKDITLLFITTIILAPIFETFFGQSLPYYLLRKVKYLKERSYLVLISSSLFFGIMHFYSLFYIIYAFFLGLIFMYGYMVRIKNDERAFLNIAICHALLNLGILIKNQI